MTVTHPHASASQAFWAWMLVARHARLGLITAFVLTAAAYLLCLTLSPVLEDRLLFMIFIPAVIGAAALGGAVPGAVATLLGLGCGLMISSAPDGLTGGDLISAFVFLLIGAAVTAGGEVFQSMRSRSVAVSRDLLAREAHLQSWESAATALPSQWNCPSGK